MYWIGFKCLRSNWRWVGEGHLRKGQWHTCPLRPEASGPCRSSEDLREQAGVFSHLSLQTSQSCLSAPQAWQCEWPPTLSTTDLWLCFSPVAVHISIYWHLFDGYEILSLVLLGQTIVLSPPSTIPTPRTVCIIVDDAAESTANYLFIVKGEGAFSHILKFVSSIFATLSILKICKCHIRQGKKSPQTPV